VILILQQGEGRGCAPRLLTIFNASLVHRFDEVPNAMTIRLHRGDLPDLSRYTDSVAIDTETIGAASASRPALRGADVERATAAPRTWCRSPRNHGKDPADAARI